MPAASINTLATSYISLQSVLVRVRRSLGYLWRRFQAETPEINPVMLK